MGVFCLLVKLHWEGSVRSLQSRLVYELFITIFKKISSISTATPMGAESSGAKSRRRCFLNYFISQFFFILVYLGRFWKVFEVGRFAKQFRFVSCFQIYKSYIVFGRA